MILYRNSEGYASPTEGAAYAHIAREERKREKILIIRKFTSYSSSPTAGNPCPEVYMSDTPGIVWTLAWTQKGSTGYQGRCISK